MRGHASGVLPREGPCGRRPLACRAGSPNDFEQQQQQQGYSSNGNGSSGNSGSSGGNGGGGFAFDGAQKAFAGGRGGAQRRQPNLAPRREAPPPPPPQPPSQSPPPTKAPPPQQQAQAPAASDMGAEAANGGGGGEGWGGGGGGGRPRGVSDSVVDSLRDQLNQAGISLRAYSPGEQRILCPMCHGGSSRELSLGVTIQEGGRDAVWNCFRGSCGWKGGTTAGGPAGKGKGGAAKAARGTVQRNTQPPVRPSGAGLVPLQAEALEFFKARGISAATLEACGVRQENDVWCPALQGKVPWAIAFPYYRDGQIVNIKYRDPEKRFWQVKGAEKILYGLDDVKDSDEVIFVEGEMDKLALYEAGVHNAVSVPDGAPPKASEGSVPPPDQDKKYAYLWNCRDMIDKAIRVVLAADNDEPGRALSEELSRRMGRERCYRVRWPTCRHDSLAPVDEGEVAQEGAADSEGADAHFRKDANEVLTRDGAEALRAYVDAAEEYPIRGLFRLSDFWGEVYDYYSLRMGDEGGVGTGWSGLDEYYRIVPGELSIVTGIPNSGKSEWLDALCVNLAENHGWTFAMCSMEKNSKDHARQLLEKRMRKPFFDLPYAGSTKRMGWPEVEEGMSWLEERIFLIRYEDDELPSVDWILNLARAAVLRHGIRGLVIDPYNELDHQRPTNMSETEYVSQMLTKVKRFAQHHECHVWFVAHPRQMRDWKGEAPNLYDISGSAHFINKADCGIVVHRNRDEANGPLNMAKILVRKVRNKAAGTIGEAPLYYDRVSGRFESAGSEALAANGYAKMQAWQSERAQAYEFGGDDNGGGGGDWDSALAKFSGGGGS